MDDMPAIRQKGQWQRSGGGTGRAHALQRVAGPADPFSHYGTGRVTRMRRTAEARQDLRSKPGHRLPIHTKRPRQGHASNAAKALVSGWFY